MRIEVLIDNEQPETYPLNRDGIIIGSSNTCDIVVSAKGVSGKHIKVYVENDLYYVADQGSTNGSFINEERLVPGRKVEFTSFFPIRLGDNVLLTLLADDEIDESELKSLNQKMSPESTNPSLSHSSTRVINLNDLRKAKTTDLVKKRQATVVKRSVSKKKKNSSSEMVKPTFLALCIIGGAVLYQFYFKEKEKVVKSNEPVQKVKEIKSDSVPENKFKLSPETNFKIDEKDRIAKEKLADFFKDLKCTTEDEKILCDNIPEMNDGLSGILQRGNSYVFLVNEKEWLIKSKDKFPAGSIGADILPELATTAPESVSTVPKDITDEAAEASEVIETKLDEIYKIAMTDFVRERVYSLGGTRMSGKTLVVAFYHLNGEAPVVSKVMIISDRGYPRLMLRFSYEALRTMKLYGYKSIADFETFFDYY